MAAEEHNVELVHIQTPAYGTHPAVHYAPSERPEHSLKVKHFFILMEDDKPTYAIELYVYINLWIDHAERTIYVSKCDTVGMSRSRVRFGEVTTRILEWLVSQDIESYYCQNIVRGAGNLSSSTTSYSKNADLKDDAPVNAVHYALVRHLQRLRTPKGAKKNHTYSLSVLSNQRTMICLFTRPAEQYLFPGSSGNTHKHTIDGQGLLRWWLKVLDPVVEQCHGNARMTIPSSEVHTIAKYLEPLTGNWTPGSLFEKGSGSCIRIIPLLPDDPKGRFLEHLVVEHRYRQVGVSQFWQELGYRQEFQLGILVGIIGVDIEHASSSPSSQNSTLLRTTANVVSRNTYKRLVDVIKGSDFSDTMEIEQLKKRMNQTKQLQTTTYTPLTTTSAHLKPTTTMAVNDLSGIVKRKLAAPVNDLTTLVKRRKNK